MSRDTYHNRPTEARSITVQAEGIEVAITYREPVLTEKDGVIDNLNQMALHEALHVIAENIASAVHDAPGRVEDTLKIVTRRAP